MSACVVGYVCLEPMTWGVATHACGSTGASALGPPPCPAHGLPMTAVGYELPPPVPTRSGAP
jgi:hypothetical protein